MQSCFGITNGFGFFSSLKRERAFLCRPLQYLSGTYSSARTVLVGGILKLKKSQ